MTELGRLKISTKAGLKEAGIKLYEMARLFGFNDIHSVRLTTIVIELLEPDRLTGDNISQKSKNDNMKK